MKEETTKTAEENLIGYIYDFAWNYGRLYHIGDADKIIKAVSEKIELPEEVVSQFASTPTSKQEGEARKYRCEQCGWSGNGGELKTRRLEDICPNCGSNHIESSTDSATQQEGRREEAVSVVETLYKEVKHETGRAVCFWDEFQWEWKRLAFLEAYSPMSPTSMSETSASFAASIPPNKGKEADPNAWVKTLNGRQAYVNISFLLADHFGIPPEKVADSFIMKILRIVFEWQNKEATKQERRRGKEAEKKPAQFEFYCCLPDKSCVSQALTQCQKCFEEELQIKQEAEE